MSSRTFPQCVVGHFFSLGYGAIAGTVLGVLVFLILILCCISCCWGDVRFISKDPYHDQAVLIESDKMKVCYINYILVIKTFLKVYGCVVWVYDIVYNIICTHVALIVCVHV